MKGITSIDGLLRVIGRNSGDNVCLKVIRNKKGDVIWKETTGTVTVKLPDMHTYTMSRSTFEKIKPYLL